MPRLAGVRERIHQPFYDTLVRTTGNPANPIPASRKLYGNANVGDLALTNLQVAGQLASDQTYVCLALRAWIYFDGPNSRTNYTLTMSQLYFTLTVGTKPQFVAPCWYFPSGGGLYGLDAADAIYNLGYPAQSAIMKLARPIIFPVRQNFNVTAEFFPVGTTDARTLLNNGADDDQKVIMHFIDGFLTRDVE